MKKIMFSILVLLAVCGTASAQWAVFDPTNLAQGIINTTKQIVQTSKTVTNTMDTFKETKKVYEQGKAYYDALKSVHNLVKDARKVQQTMLMIGEISEIYVHNFEKMLADPNFSVEELDAIGRGYGILLGESSNVLSELKNAVNATGLSMSDKERIDLVDRAYTSVLGYRSLVKYYTNKNIGVSYLRGKKKNDTDRVMSLYGNPHDKYW